MRARAVLAGIDDGLIEATAEEQAAQCDLVRRREHDWDVIGLLCAVAAFEESTGASSGASFERFVRLLEDTAAREELLYAARHFSAGPCDEAGHEEGRAPAAPETAA